MKAMHPLLKETEYATQNLFSLLPQEEQKLQSLEDQRTRLEAEFRMNQWDFETSDLNDDFPETYAMAAHARMGRAHANKTRVEAEMAEIQARIASREMATQAVAGAILQIAKQLLSLTHGKLPGIAPQGPAIGTTYTTDVILAGRNQSMHYEEGEPTGAHTRKTFKALAESFGDTFNLVGVPPRNRAKEVIGLLGWETYEQYVATMTGLLHREAAAG